MTNSPKSVLKDTIRIARLRQWMKNLLVFAAPAAAGMLLHEHVLVQALIGFSIFCITSSGVYFINDSIDAEADRWHPLKRNRPIAAGRVSVPMAIAVGTILLTVGISLGFLVSGWHLGLVVVLYVAITIAYSLWLKNEPVIDLFAVASGFVLRGIAGGVATGIPLSEWFLLVISFGALLIVTGKRCSEHQDLGDDRGYHRPILNKYSLQFLDYIKTLSSAVTVTAYCLWAFEKASYQPHSAIWFQLSIIPFVIAILIYA